MRKLILLAALLFPSLALAQGSRIDGVVQGLDGPLPNQFVAVCTQPANITTTPCSALATLYTDITLTVVCTGSNGCSNPIETDEFGNYHFYAATGKYTVQSYGAQIQTPYVQRDVILPCDPDDCLVNGITANTPDPALTGFIRLEHDDEICWRNFANSGDLCLSVDGSDNIQFPGGFGGGGGPVTNVTASLPLASSGGATPNISISVVQGNGTKVQLSTGTTTTNDCVKYDANGNTVDAGAPCGGSGGAVLSPQTTCNLSSNITSINSSTLTTIITCVAVAPSSGCPCRAFISWDLAGGGTSSTQQVTGFVTDGTHIFAGTSNTIDNQVTLGEKSVNRSAYSPTTYTNSQSVTFTLKAESDHTWDALAVTTFSSLPSQVQVNYIPSN